MASSSSGFQDRSSKASSSIFRNYSRPRARAVDGEVGVGPGVRSGASRIPASPSGPSTTPNDAPRTLSRGKARSTIRDSNQDGGTGAGSLPPPSAASASQLSQTSRGALLAAKREELDNVYRQHDGLVRELFHLTKFVTYFGFDPEVAAQDRSDVFERFRMEYDLPTKLSGASGRATRRIVSAKRGDLDLQHAAANGKKHAASPKKADEVNGKSKGRKEEEEIHPREEGKAPVKAKRGPGRPRKSAIPVSSSDSSSSSSDEGRIPTPSAAPKRRLVKATKRRATHLSSSESPDPDRAPPQAKRKVGRPRKRAVSVEYAPREPVVVEQVEGVPRVRVLQPNHLPLPPVHGGSLATYLSSWHTSGDYVGGGIGEMEVLSLASLEARERRDARLYDAIDAARAQGLLQDRDEAVRKSIQNRAKEPQRAVMTWDATLQAMSAESTKRRVEMRNKIAICKRLARMVQLYWDEKLGRGEKQKREEIKRMRAMAKWTVREVRKQWKLAVNVIKAKRSLREKEEKDRVGRAQLRTILEQSSQMLGKQHRALVQGEASDEDSATGSVSDASETGEESGEDSSGDSDEESGLDEDERMSDDEEEALRGETETASAVGEESEGKGSDGEEEDDLGQLLSHPPAQGAPHLSMNGHTTPPPPAPNGRTSEGEGEGGERMDKGGRSMRPYRQAGKLDVPLINGANEEDPGNDDVEFEMREDVGEEDEELERQMWEDDESESDEEQGLQDDADLSIDELMKRYGYGEGEPEEAVEPGEDSTAASPKIVELDNDSDGNRSEPDTRQSSLVSHRQRSRTRDSSTAASASTGVKIKPPFLLRGTLRPYQQIGFEWLANLYNNGSNGILADEMGLGKTIQTIALLAHLACDKGEWGPHLVVAPTSVMLNWEVEFKKFLPGFKILSYYGSQKERKEKRKGWNSDNYFNICITSYQLILADQHILRRKAWQYLILDEAHHIKNFKSQRWQTLLGFHSKRRLLLTGTPLQNNLMDLWSLMYFLMPNGITSADGVVNSGFASMKEFQQWFSNPLGKAVESAGMEGQDGEVDDETRGMVSKLHTLLRPYLLRRLKMEVEKELPNKYEHVIKCRLSKRQTFLYNDFMSRAKTRESLASGNYLSIINCLMQLRKVCNHPDLFEQRPIVTSFAASKSVVAEYEIKELLIRRELLREEEGAKVDLSTINLRFNSSQQANLTPIVTRSLAKLDASDSLSRSDPPELTPIDTWTVEGYKSSMERRRTAERAHHWKHVAYLNRLRCQARPPELLDRDSVHLIQSIASRRHLLPFSVAEGDNGSFQDRSDCVHRAILGYNERREAMQDVIDRFAFVTPRAVVNDMTRWALPGLDYSTLPPPMQSPGFDTLHQPAVKLQIAFPDASLLQYDCGKLQELALLMQRCKAGNHRILIFTQMTKILDILEIWLSYNGYNYLRLDGSTKVEDRQALTERFNRDERIKAFILSTRSGGLGINLTGADMVLFWDLDWNFQIEAQCMDRAHRIGQTRDVHIYRFVSEHTIEENMLKKSNEKRMLDDMVIQNGQFTTEGLGKMSWIESMFDEGGKTIAGVQVGSNEGGGAVGGGANDRGIESAMDQVEDEEDANAAKNARLELHLLDDDFQTEMSQDRQRQEQPREREAVKEAVQAPDMRDGGVVDDGDEEEEEAGTVDDYMLRRVDEDWDYFANL